MTYTTGYETEVDESEDLERAVKYLLNQGWEGFREDVLLADTRYCNSLEDLEKLAAQYGGALKSTLCVLAGDLEARAAYLAYEHANPSDTRRRDEEAKADAMVDRLDFGDAA